MNGLLDQNPTLLSALNINPEDLRRQQQQAGLLSAGLQLLAGSGYSPVRQTTGQLLGQAGLAGVQGMQQAGETAIDRALKGLQAQEFVRRQQQAELVRQAMPNVFRTEVTSPGQFGRGLSMADPTARMMAAQNAELAGERGLSMLESAANYPVQGTGREEFLKPPETRTALNQQTLATLRSQLPPKEYRELVGGLKEELEIMQPKVDFFTSGNIVYAKDPTAKGGLRMVVDNSGQLTGEYANLANLLYKTTDPRQLTKSQVENIIAQINKKAMLEGGGGDTLGKTGMGEVDKALLSSGSRLITLNRIQEGYDPRFLETKFKGSMAIRSLGEKMGGTLSETQRAELTNYTQFRQDAVRQLNQYINEITGAAIGQGEEAERLKAGVPNPGSGLFDGDGPTEFAAKLSNTLRDLKMVEARLYYIKKNGLKINDVSLASMPRIMKDREQQLVTQFKLDPNNAADRTVLKNRLAQEFGLLQ